jgi:hypothetical protein
MQHDFGTPLFSFFPPSQQLPLTANVKLSGTFGLCHATSMLETRSGICGGPQTHKLYQCENRTETTDFSSELYKDTQLPTRNVQWIVCKLLSRSKHQTKQAWVRSTNSLHDMDIGMGQTAPKSTKNVRKVSSYFEYLGNRFRGLYVTWQPVRGDLTVHPWIVTLPWG